MSQVFSHVQLGNIQLSNRVVNSASYEALATPDGMITDNLLRRYRILAGGGIGLIVTGHCYVHPSGKAGSRQIGIHDDSMIPGLSDLVSEIHNNGGKVFPQLAHAGRQTIKQLVGHKPKGPSVSGPDPINQVRCSAMTEAEIHEAIDAFGDAARRASEAGADGIQLHGAHGYLISQFLSPFFNKRTDSWGGSDENRFRFLKDVIESCRRNMPDGMPVMVKLNSDDFLSGKGVTPELAVGYASRLNEIGVDAIELSCGVATYSFLTMCRGEVPVKEFISDLPAWKKPFAYMLMKSLEGKHALEEGYNLSVAALIKPVLNNTLLSVVGGFRSLTTMEQVISGGQSDLVSVCRPFIREPKLLDKFRNGKSNESTCTSCNKCLAAVFHGRPLRCYEKNNQ